MPNPKLETYKNKATNVVYDYTDADAQSQLSSIKDGTTIDSFGDVETALSTKYDINDESQISILDYDYVPYYADAESATRKIYWTNIKNGLKSFFDDLYCAIGLVPSGASSSNKLATASDVNDVWQANAVLGAKNFLPLTLASLKASTSGGSWNGNVYTNGGVDYTVSTNDAGYVTEISANGTAGSSDSYFRITTKLADYLTVGERYTLNGCPSDGGISRYCVYTGSAGVWEDDGNGADKDYNSTLTSLFLKVNHDVTVSNLKFYPMIRLASDPSTTYAPHVMTNKQLTDKVTLIDDATKITFAEGVASYGASYFSFDNVGNLNVISGLINGVVANADTWVTIGSIASGFRPKRTYFGFAGIVSTSEVVELQIYSDGNISLRRNGGAIVATNNIRIFAVYAS